MGWLERWDLRNQRLAEAQNESDEVGRPGVVTIWALPALVRIALATLVVTGALLLQRQLWAVAAAALALLIGGVLCVDLARDVREDVGEWRRRRREERR